MTQSQLTALALGMLAAAAVPGLLTWKASTMSKNLPQPSQSFSVSKPDEEWRALLTPKQYAVLRLHDTEYPGTSLLLGEHRDGTFVCAGCRQPLFASDAKYESGSGWPSFYAAIEGAIATSEDRTLGMTRVEIHCSRCGGHLGHLFPDGPQPTGRRYCTNGAALVFDPAESTSDAAGGRTRD